MIPKMGALAVSASVVAFAAALSPAMAVADENASNPEIVVDWRVLEDTGSEFQVAATIRNETTSAYERWAIGLPFRHSISEIEGAVSVQDRSAVTISGTRPLPAGKQHSVKMVVISAGPVSRIPSTCTLAGVPCRLVVPDEPESEISEQAQANSDDFPNAEASSDADADESAGPSDTNGPSEIAGPKREGATASASPQLQRLVISMTTTSDWGTGQSSRVKLRNQGPATINEWSVAIPWQVTVDSMWNANSTSGGNVVRAENVAWNGRLEPGEAIEFGFTGSPGSSVVPSGSCSAQTNLGETDCLLVP
jgi:hypothetical protein